MVETQFRKGIKRLRYDNDSRVLGNVSSIQFVTSLFLSFSIMQSL